VTQPEDPLLRQRVQARADVLRTERDIRDAFWSQLSDWLVQLSRRVLRGDTMRPDTDAVWALSNTWRAAVDLVIEKAILPAMQRAYRSIMGDEFDLESRPAFSRYLAEVRNRMARTPEEVYDLIAGQVSAGVNSGDSIPQLAARIEQTLSATGTDRWENRATTVARTEAIGALNAAKLEAFRQYRDEWGEDDLVKVWISTDDARTRPTHAAADGQRAGLDEAFIVGGARLQFPGDPTGPADEVINCRCGLLLVSAGERIDYSNRQMRRNR
jgi:hypothetical protein